MKIPFRRRPAADAAPYTVRPGTPDDGTASAVTNNPLDVNAQNDPGCMGVVPRSGHVPWSITLTWQGCADTEETAQREAVEVGRRVAKALGVDAKFMWNGRPVR